jgi:N4-gp56 family major capsid protein
MAVGEFAITAPLTRKLWEDEAFIAAETESFFKSHGFIGDTPNSIIYRKTDLTKEKGDSITFGQLDKLDPTVYVQGDNTLRGNEQQVVPNDCTVTVDQYRNGIVLAGKMNEQKSAINMRKGARDLLKIWLAEFRDWRYFNVLCADVASGRQTLCSATHATEGTLDANDKVTLTYLRKAHRLAKNASPKIKPIKYKGKNWFVIVLHTNQMRDLLDDPEVQAILQNAAPRSYDDNPLFAGANVILPLDGMLIYEHENIRVTTTGSGGIKVGHGLLLGCAAVIEGIAKEAIWEEDDLIDYRNKVGFCTGTIHGVKRTTFNGKEWGVWKILSACVDD